MVASASDDRSNKFDFDADFSVWIDLAFHTSSVAHGAQSASENRDLFAAIVPTISATAMRLDLELSAAEEPSEVVGATRVDRLC